MIFVDVAGSPVAIHTGDNWQDPMALAVVLIHGAGGDHTAWRYQTRFLGARGFAAIAVDMPGHGRSGGEPLESIEAMGAWLTRLLDGLPQSRFVVMGHSMGSLVALEAGSRDPGRVVALVLMGTTNRMAVHPELLQAAQARDESAVDLMIGWMRGRSHRFGGHAAAGFWVLGSTEQTLLNHLEAALGTDLVACDSYDPVAAAKRVEQPVLVVQGSNDRMTPVAGARALVALLADAKLVEIESSGHLSLIEEPQLVNRHVDVLLSTLSGAVV